MSISLFYAFIISLLSCLLIHEQFQHGIGMQYYYNEVYYNTVNGLPATQTVPQHRPPKEIPYENIPKEEKTIHTTLKPEQCNTRLATQHMFAAQNSKHQFSKKCKKLIIVPFHNTICRWLNKYMYPAMDRNIKEQKNLSTGNS